MGAIRNRVGTPDCRRPRGLREIRPPRAVPPARQGRITVIPIPARSRHPRHQFPPLERALTNLGLQARAGNHGQFVTVIRRHPVYNETRRIPNWVTSIRLKSISKQNDGSPAMNG